MIVRLNVRKILLFLFVALGPLGNILTPYFLPASFRIYYCLLPCFPIFFLMMRERLAKLTLLFFPFLTFAFVSAVFVNTFGEANEEHTLFRFFLLFCQLLFIIGAASSLKRKEELISILKTYLWFYFLSMAIGYVLFFGYYAKAIPFSIVERFCVLAQFGWGLLRFSPGSYPNEYGIVSSFVLCILILIYLGKQYELFGLTKKRFAFLFSGTFLAFLLTTTRAAYLSFLVSFLYICWKTGNLKKILLRFSIFIAAIFFSLMLLKINMFKILITGFSQKITEGSLGERYFMWQDSLQRFEENEILGVGFASLTNVHNVYIQLLFELGLVGSVILIGTLLLAFVEIFLKYKRPPKDENALFLNKIKLVGLVNVLSFAASNHNLNHHLTWFVFFLCLASLRLPFLEESHA